MSDPHYPAPMLTFFVATTDILPLGIHHGDTVSVDSENPDEPVIIHHPAVGVTVQRLATAIGSGALERVSASVPAPLSATLSASLSADPTAAVEPAARPRLRLLRAGDQLTA